MHRSLHCNLSPHSHHKLISTKVQLSQSIYTLIYRDQQRNIQRKILKMSTPKIISPKFYPEDLRINSRNIQNKKSSKHGFSENPRPFWTQDLVFFWIPRFEVLDLRASKRGIWKPQNSKLRKSGWFGSTDLRNSGNPCFEDSRIEVSFFVCFACKIISGILKTKPQILRFHFEDLGYSDVTSTFEDLRIRGVWGGVCFVCEVWGISVYRRVPFVFRIRQTYMRNIQKKILRSSKRNPQILRNPRSHRQVTIQK